MRYVLEGSVRKAASRVRITGQLIDSATGAHLWADRFEGALYDRSTLDVRTRDGGFARAQVYVVREAQRHTLSREPWDKRSFESESLSGFVQRLRR